MSASGKSLLLLIGLAGAGLVALCSFLSPFAGGAGAEDACRDAPENQPAAAQGQNSRPSSDGSPRPSTQHLTLSGGGDEMRLTVPTMHRVKDVPVRSAPGTEEWPLRDGAMHVAGTGFPWQPRSNTYIAGHRLGFPGTRSERLFWDLDSLENGHRVLLEDADGRGYEYAVFRRMVVEPDDVSVTMPVEGRLVVSLQTCTLPDYARRLVVQAKLINASEGTPPADTAPAHTAPAHGAFGLSGQPH